MHSFSSEAVLFDWCRRLYVRCKVVVGFNAAMSAVFSGSTTPLIGMCQREQRLTEVDVIVGPKNVSAWASSRRTIYHNRSPRRESPQFDCRFHFADLHGLKNSWCCTRWRDGVGSVISPSVWFAPTF
ncbi:unnamed protein product [Scytosiphon promiscuus]